MLDRAYFDKFANWLKGAGEISGHKALHYTLSKMDITGFQPRDVPCTKMLLQHKLANMDDVHSCFYEWMARNQVLSKTSDNVIGVCVLFYFIYLSSHTYRLQVGRRWRWRPPH